MIRNLICLRQVRTLICLGVLAGVLAKSTAHAANTVRILPLQTTATFTSQSKAAGWTCPVKSPKGRTIYTFSLEPQLDIHGDPVVVDLALRRSNGSNILKPEGRWHGLQPYMFAALDLENGPKMSGSGRRRTIIVKRPRLVLQITIRGSKVSQLADGTFQIEMLNLEIKADNLSQ